MSVKQRNRGESVKNMDLHRVILGTVVGLAVCMILLFAASWFVEREKLTMEAAPWISAVVAFLAAFSAGYIATRNNRKKLLSGLLAANFAWLLLLICGMLLFSAPMESERLAVNSAVIQLGAIGSAVLSGLRE